MVYSSKQQPTTPLLVVGHEISFGNGDSASNNSRRGGNGNVVVSGGSGAGAGRNHHQMAVSSGGGGGVGGLGDVSSGSAGGSSALGYWNRSPVALNKSSNRYIDQSKVFIEDAYVKRGGGGVGIGDVGRSPYYQPQQQQQAMNRHGGYYAGNINSQPNSRTNSMTRPPPPPTTNRYNPASAAATAAHPMNDDDLSEVSRKKGLDIEKDTVEPQKVSFLKEKTPKCGLRRFEEGFVRVPIKKVFLRELTIR